MQLHEEKIAAIQEKLELSDQKLTQYSKLPEMEEELKARMEALTQVGSQVGRVFQMLTRYQKTSVTIQPYCLSIKSRTIFLMSKNFFTQLLFYARSFGCNLKSSYFSYHTYISDI